MTEPQNTSTSTEEVAETRDKLTDFIHAVMTNWRALLIGLAAILVIALLVRYVQDSQQEAELSAWAAAAEARNHPDREDLADRLEKVAESHPGTQAAFFSRMELVQTYFDNNKPKKARKTAEALLAANPGHAFVPQIRTDLGRLLEGEGRWTEAQAQYDQVLKHGDSYLRAEALLGKARCLEQNNDKKGAEAIYTEIYRQTNMPSRIRNDAELSLMALADPGRPIEEPKPEVKKEDKPQPPKPAAKK